MTSPYSFCDRLVLRTPSLPLPEKTIDIDFVALLHNPSFLEAIYLASPALYDECVKWRDGLITNANDIDKLQRTVAKYLLRMSSRCVPFGLFSGCAVTGWSDGNTSVTINTHETARHTRLDMHYVGALAKELTLLPGIKEYLHYFPNNSIYSIGDELRYIEYTYNKEKRNYKISAVTASSYITGMLQYAAGGKTIGQLAQWLMQQGIEEAEAAAFIEEIIDAQILVSELEPCITGKEFMHQLIECLERISMHGSPNNAKALKILCEVSKCLKKLDTNPVNNIPAYRNIKSMLNEFQIGCEENKLFQTDLAKTVYGGIDKAIQQQLMEALEILNKLTVPVQNSDLLAFATRFAQRYEQKELPLLQVLDAETGIGYPENGAAPVSPLTGDIQLSRRAAHEKIHWSNLEVYLNNKLMEAVKNAAIAIEIKDEELTQFSANWNDLPASFPVMFRITDAQSNTIYLESVGGSSGANLLARFAYADPKMNELVHAIAAREQENDPEIIYAEIVHLPQNRTGNILLHPAFRQYEIPYLAASSQKSEYRIDVSDLYVSVKSNRIMLRSRRLNKQVIPRLSNAHNYSNHTLPVYRFLCDLQLQDKRNALYFSWSSLQLQHSFLPRVTYKNTILYLATWNFLQKDIQPLIIASGNSLHPALAAFRNKWRLPRYIVLSDYDNELLIDLDNETMVHMWLETVKHRHGFTVKEFMHGRSPVVDETGARYVNQAIAILIKNAACYKNESKNANKDADTAAPRRFTIGTEWLYYKLYCGVKSADKILLEAIKPLTEELTAKGLIDKWFFVRYNDPDFHVRVRFHLTDVGNIGTVVSTIHKNLALFEDDGYIWKCQLDVYEREMERYGSNTIGLAESLFYHDSVSCLQMLTHTQGDERENLRWLWGLRAIEELLNRFEYSVHKKLVLLENLKNAFATEFHLDKPVKRQLDDKYRNNRQMINEVMKQHYMHGDRLYPLIHILQIKSHHIHAIAEAINHLHASGNLAMPLDDLLGSYIHMMINRIVACEPRMHEMIMYDFMFRYYQSAIARAKSSDTRNPLLMQTATP